MPPKPYTYNFQDVLDFITSYKQLHDGNSPTWNTKNITGGVFVRNHRRLKFP